MYYLSGPPLSWLFFLAVFASMQAAEGLYWKKWLNAKNTSRLITLILALELILIIRHFQPPYRIVCYVLAGIFLLVALVQTWDQKVAVASNGHLRWPITTFPFLFIMWTVLYFYPPIVTRRWKFVMYNMFLYLVCLYLFVRHGTFGSMWCWISNIVFIFYAVEMLFLQPISC